MRVRTSTKARRGRAVGSVPAALALVAGALALAPAAAEAQRWSPALEGRGWIGISFEVQSDRWGRTSSVLITDVRAGSPAAEAGIRPGDRLLGINEFTRPAELAELTDRLHLRPGDRVVMEVERAGERYRMRLRAAERPDDVDIERRIEVVLAPDDQVETWVRSMDSLRIELIQQGGGTIRLRASGPSDERITVLSPLGEPPSVRAPFEFFVFRGEGHDSLRAEMLELNRLGRDLEERLEVRERIVRRQAMSTDPLHLVADDEFRRISESLDEVQRRSAALSAAMAESARQSAGLAYEVDGAAPAPSAPRVGTVAGRVPRPEAREEFRPLTPYILGRNRVAGAEVVEVRPELAEYFQVDGGVLVVDVAERTPAATAGIVPGDVIVRIDQVGVSSVEELRFGVSMAGDSLPVTLVRKGRSVQVLLRF